MQTLVTYGPAATAFLADALAWSRGDNTRAKRLLRSRYSRVPRDVAAAYATLAQRYELIDEIGRGRLTLPPQERAALRVFVTNLQHLRDAAADGGDDAKLTALAAAEFEVAGDEPLESAPRLPLVLCDAQIPEPAAAMRARGAHFSASALNAYAECERKWFYRYLCRAVEDKSSSASSYGSAFHVALQDFHGEFPRPSEADESEMRNRVAEYVTWAFARYRNDFETAVEFELQRRRALRTAQRYIDWIVAQARKAPFTVVGRELEAELEIEGFEFIGYIDRIDRDDSTGAIAIIDYKTGTIATTATQYRDKVRRFQDFQLPLYYWARTAQGDRVHTLALVPLKDAMLDVAPISLEVVPVAANDWKRSDSPTGTIGIADLERARTEMVKLCRELTGNDPEKRLERFAEARDPEACTFCAYVVACAHRPIPVPGRFGR